MTKRRRFSADFKARVALEALRGDKTIQEIAVKHKVHRGHQEPAEAAAHGNAREDHQFVSRPAKRGIQDRLPTAELSGQRARRKLPDPYQ